MATVLIVEDEPVLLILAESVLQTAGYDTLSASSLLEVQGILESDVKLDLLFTDLTLHDDHEAGYAVAKLVSEKRSGTPVLYTSGRELTDGLKALFVERSEFVGKPYTDKLVLEAMERLLRLRSREAE
jgi:DNA-binding NtrC family response regulator